MRITDKDDLVWDRLNELVPNEWEAKTVAGQFAVIVPGRLILPGSSNLSLREGHFTAGTIQAAAEHAVKAIETAALVIPLLAHLHHCEQTTAMLSDAALAERLTDIDLVDASRTIDEITKAIRMALAQLGLDVTDDYSMIEYRRAMARRST